MITALDSNVIFDVLAGGSPYASASEKAVVASIHSGEVVACEVVWAETAAWFPSMERQRAAFAQIGIGYVPCRDRAAFEAGRAWKRYREAGGQRTRVMADFLIGAHALVHADALLTRDRGFYRNHFTELRIVDPTAG